MPSFQAVTIQELLELAQKQADRQENWTRHEEVTPSDPKSILYWAYMVLQPKHFDPPLLLVGLLDSSRSSGELKLQDKTGRVACVVSQSAAPPYQPHICYKDMCQSSAKPSVNSCPFVHSWNLNWIIRVDRFQLVIERFVQSDNNSLSQGDDKAFRTGYDIKVSVQFSMCDVVNLHKVRKAGRLERAQLKKRAGRARDNTPEGPPAKKGVVKSSTCQKKSTENETEIPKGAKVESEIEGIEAKAPGNLAHIQQTTAPREDVQSAPRTSPSLSDSASCLKHPSDESKLQSALWQPSCSDDNRSNDQSSHKEQVPQSHHCVCQDFFLVHKDYPALQQSADRTTTLGFYCSGLFLGNAVVGEESMRQSHEVKADKGEDIVDIREVAILFTGDAMQWYQVLQEGCMYRIICPNTTDPAVFATKMKSAALRRAVDATKCKICVVLPTGITVEQLSEYKEKLCASRLDPILSVETLCKTKFDQKSRLISFSCSLVSRRYDEKCQSGRGAKPFSDSHSELGVSSMAGHCLQLTVQDLSSPFYTLVIYADFSTGRYPLGMLPGSVLTFRRLEVRMSKKNKLYCHFNSSSSVRVEALLHTDMSKSLVVGPAPPTSVENLHKVPEVCLGQLISIEGGQQVMVKVVCQIVCVKYLYMQYTCSKCGQIFSSGQCQNRPCLSSSSDPGHFTAKASVLVDDGTGTAHVHCQQDVIGGVLKLTDNHWNILKRQAQKKGRLTLRQSGWDNNDWMPDGDGCESPVEALLTSLCESPLVRRPVQLYCQVNSAGHTSDTNSTEKDYPVATLEIGGVRYLTHVHPAVHLHCWKLDPVE